MKAIIATKYGGPEVLQLQEVVQPAPQDNEVLIRVHSASITTADSMMRTGKPYFGRLFMGLLKPKKQITGTGFAGKVEAIGKNVTLFKTGDDVFGESAFGPGTNAEYLCIEETALILPLPMNINYSEAASICDGPLTSLNMLWNKANIRAGQKVLINGASGSLGNAAIQLAKHFGAEVTGVTSTSNIELVKSLGADRVIDYKKEDFAKCNDQNYDIIYDTIGKLSFSKCKGVLSKNGIYISPVLSVKKLFQMVWTSLFGSKKVMFDATGLRPIEEQKAMLGELQELFTAGIIKTVIDKSYSLAEIATAHQYIDTGHKKGNVVLDIINSDYLDESETIAKQHPFSQMDKSYSNHENFLLKKINLSRISTIL